MRHLRQVNRRVLIVCALVGTVLAASVLGGITHVMATTGGPKAQRAGPVAPYHFAGSVAHLPPGKRSQSPQLDEFDGPTAPAPQPSTGDRALQKTHPATSAPSPLTNFSGLDFANWGAGWPPDPNGDVGPNDYIETVNTSVGIFRKSDGAQLAAFTFNALWNGAGTTPCNGFNNGDPTSTYDSLADRWFVSDFAWSNFTSGPFYECIAVSQTGDPVSGGWYLYAWEFETGALLPDYPKMGIWPDGLYVSTNVFATNPESYQYAQIWALNRTEMESGATATGVYFTVPNGYSLLPSNMRTATGSPPSGSPNYFTSLGGNGLEVYEFHVDYNTYTNSTLTGPFSPSVSGYFYGPDNVPEKGGNNIDTLNDRLMMQNQYVDIGGDESLWLTHTVGNGGNPNIAQVRWYQLDVTGGTVAGSVTQQGTWSPDSLNRFMPSLAVDKNGDMAIGYSASDANTYAAIRYAGRLSGDPLNTLGQGETSLIEGSGFQCCNYGSQPMMRWGDYSAMTLDPTDGCTFWYTNEYYDTQPTTLSADDWKTRIGSFKFDACSKSATNLTVNTASGPYGGTATLSATLTSGGNGVSGKTVSFTLNGGSVGGATTDSNGLASLSGVSLGSISPGSYPGAIGASFGGDGTYDSISRTGTLTVNQASQSITFGSLPNKTFGSPDFTVSATASSGLPVSFGASGNCTVSGSTVHLTGVGGCTITASQAGNANYSAAPNVPQTFSILSPQQTIGAYNPSNGVFYLRNSNSGGNANNAFVYGPPGCVPLSGDWTGKGYDSVGVYCPSNGVFYLKNTNSGGNADAIFPFGPANCQPLVGDWTSKGYDSVGVDCNGVFYLRNSNSGGNANFVIHFGPATGCNPLAGDWNSKGYDSIGIDCSGTFYLRNSNTAGNADIAFVFGPSTGCLPVTGDWTGKGYDSAGIYCGNVFYLRNSNSGGNADIAFAFGAAGFKPLAGEWTLPSANQRH